MVSPPPIENNLNSKTRYARLFTIWPQSAFRDSFCHSYALTFTLSLPKMSFLCMPTYNPKLASKDIPDKPNL